MSEILIETATFVNSSTCVPAVTFRCVNFFPWFFFLSLTISLWSFAWENMQFPPTGLFHLGAYSMNVKNYVTDCKLTLTEMWTRNLPSALLPSRPNFFFLFLRNLTYIMFFDLDTVELAPLPQSHCIADRQRVGEENFYRIKGAPYTGSQFSPTQKNVRN